MLGVRFNSGIDALVNDGVVVICLMDYLLTVYLLEALFSQMNILRLQNKMLAC